MRNFSIALLAILLSACGATSAPPQTPPPSQLVPTPKVIPVMPTNCRELIRAEHGLLTRIYRADSDWPTDMAAFGLKVKTILSETNLSRLKPMYDQCNTALQP